MRSLRPSDLHRTWDATATDLQIARARAASLVGLALVAEAQGDLADARRFVTEATSISETLRDARFLGLESLIRGLISLDEGDLDEAVVEFQNALTGAAERGDRTLIVRTVEAIGRIVVQHGDLRRAATLFGGAALLREAVPWPVPPVDEHWYEAVISRLRHGLGAQASKTAWDEGRAMSMEDLVRLASAYSHPPGDGAACRARTEP